MTLFDLLGFAKKANKMVCGMSNCLNAVIKKKAKLVIIAEDAGVSRKKLIKECELNGVPFIEFGTREQFIDRLGMMPVIGRFSRTDGRCNSEGIN